jgi:colanic acid biosynthesis protein WcaH
MSQNQESNYIPDNLYNQIMNVIPIVSVEAMIVNNQGILFLKRNNQPAKGEWWFPGGRMRKGETFEETLRREVKEETGLEVSETKFINVYSRVFPLRHDITIAYLCKTKEGKIHIDNEHSEFGFFTEPPTGIHDFLVEMIKESKWEAFV